MRRGGGGPAKPCRCCRGRAVAALTVWLFLAVAAADGKLETLLADRASDDRLYLKKVRCGATASAAEQHGGTPAHVEKLRKASVLAMLFPDKMGGLQRPGECDNEVEATLASGATEEQPNLTRDGSNVFKGRTVAGAAANSGSTEHGTSAGPDWKEWSALPSAFDSERCTINAIDAQHLSPGIKPHRCKNVWGTCPNRSRNCRGFNDTTLKAHKPLP